MTHPAHSNNVHEVVQLLADHGFDGLTREYCPNTHGVRSLIEKRV
jgi:hypothetical protein